MNYRKPVSGPYVVIQAGYVGPERYASREEAQAEADRLNADMEDECGDDCGDGAASVARLDEVAS